MDENQLKRDVVVTSLQATWAGLIQLERSTHSYPFSRCNTTDTVKPESTSDHVTLPDTGSQLARRLPSATAVVRLGGRERAINEAIRRRLDGRDDSKAVHRHGDVTKKRHAWEARIAAT